MPAPVPTEVVIFADAPAMRAWLAEHHDTETELWAGLYKKGVPKQSVRYHEAVEEALCFGWIDGISRRVDHEVVAQRFTPRRRTSSWSAVNIAKVAELTEAGRMHPAGLAAFEGRDRRKDASYSRERAASSLPPEFEEQLRSDERVWSFWQAQIPSYRRTVTHWVMSAKQEKTRRRRLATLVDDCRNDRLVKQMSYGGARPKPRPQT
jgi:uncharacterized protein YdeI (YjbR/CyaY-like superfamily)